MHERVSDAIYRASGYEKLDRNLMAWEMLNAVVSGGAFHSSKSVEAAFSLVDEFMAKINGG
jgi:hypothetical protein